MKRVGTTTGRISKRRTTTKRLRRRRRGTTKRQGATGRTRLMRPMMLRMFFGVIALGGLVACAHFGWETLCYANRLRVLNIDIAGASRVPSRDIAAYTGIAIGDSMLKIDLDGVAMRLRRHPWVRDVTVRRRLPQTISIEVHEHQPKIFVSTGTVYVANQEGELFKRMATEDALVLPVVTGLTRQDLADAHGIHPAVQEAIALNAAINAAALGRLDELHFDLALGWDAMLLLQPNNAVLVHLGQKPTERLAWVRRAFQRMAAMNKKPLELWVDHPGQKKFVQARFVERVNSYKQTLIAKAGE